jgi:hypothetical protein
MHAVSRPSLFLVATLSLTLLSAITSAECSPPSSPGVRICSPTPNATVVYFSNAVAQIPAIDFNSTPAFGTQIVKYSVYDNNHKVAQDTTGTSGAELLLGSIKNGLHRVVVNAWDNSGKLYQANVSFRVIGDAFPFPCPVPSSPGVNFCVPPAGAILGPQYDADASARGNSSISAIRLYIDGKAQETQLNFNELNTLAFVGTQGDHRLSFVAWDTTGHVFKSSRVIHSAYTYSFLNCPPKGNDPCTAGFDVSSPQNNSYVANSFTIMATVEQNPNPITAMKAYIDNTVVAVSNGPTMASNVENAPSGTHILTLQAWDTKGVLYRIQSNVNINVAH